ncbi:MAG: GYD domain-containing protein [Pirellulaceae bacterium]
MVRYLSLLNFTEQGIRDVKHSTTRAAAFQADVEKAGGKVLSLYWSIGEVDGAIVFEAPDDGTAAALLMKLAQQGNVRTRSARVLTATEFANSAAKV